LDAERLLGGDEGRAEVLAEEGRYKSLGVSGVPAFFVGGEPAFSGAAESRPLAEAVRRASEELAAPPPKERER
jgi:predicted DsbA family dithiol-disulfide isomerase